MFNRDVIKIRLNCGKCYTHLWENFLSIFFYLCVDLVFASLRKVHVLLRQEMQGRLNHHDISGKDLIMGLQS